MQLETMSLDPRIARIHYLDYRKKVREHKERRLAQAMVAITETGKALRTARTTRELIEKEDEELMRAYRAMALGQRILNLTKVLRGAGVDKQHHPKLAIARAHWKHCHFRVDRGHTFFMASDYLHYSNTRWNKDSHIMLPRDLFPAETSNTSWRDGQNLPRYPLKALVPSIPAHLRPEGDLSGYHVLWEAVWTSAAPEDPFLLKQVSENVFVVLAQWDLTPLEQSILEGRIG